MFFFALTVTKDVFLTQTKGHPRRVYFSIFSPYINQRPTTKWVFSFLALTWPLPYQMPIKKGVVLYFCPNPSHGPTTKGVLYICALTKALPHRAFFSILELTITKSLPQWVFSPFCQTSHKGCLFFPNPKKRPSTKFIFSIFPIHNHRPTTKCVFSFFP